MKCFVPSSADENDLTEIPFLSALGNGHGARKFSAGHGLTEPLVRSNPQRKGRRTPPQRPHIFTRQDSMADPKAEASIENLRAQIDAIDDEMLALVRRRFNLSRRIMTDEHRFGMPVEVFSHDREQQTIDRLKKLNEESDCPMRSAHIGNIWQMIFSCTRVGW